MPNFGRREILDMKAGDSFASAEAELLKHRFTIFYILLFWNCGKPTSYFPFYE